MRLGDTPFFKTGSTIDRSPVRIGLLMLLLLALTAGWLVWFASAPLPRLARSSAASLNANGRISATFSPEAAVGLTAGQPVRITLPDFPETLYGDLQGEIRTVDSSLRDGLLLVEIELTGNPRALPLQRGLPAVVEINQGTTTPLQTVWQTLRGGLD